jgi:nucleoside-diphosphate-sugar epimerase
VRVAVTGGTGFVGGHLARSLAAQGHEVVVVARGLDQRIFAREVLGLTGVTHVPVSTCDPDGLIRAFEGCEAVAHCAGINREIGTQTYEEVHVRGTSNVVRAAESAGVRRLAFTSFLRARPDCGSAYHESSGRQKRSSELPRASGRCSSRA